MKDEYLKYFGDDMTFCMAKCATNCRRKPEHILDTKRWHSYADFSRECMAYEPKESENDE